MLLKDYLSSERCECIRESVQNLINFICISFGNRQYHPCLEMQKVKNLLIIIDEIWRNNVMRRWMRGRPCERISIIQKCNRYDFERDFIRKELGFIMNHKQNKYQRMNYNYKTYRELCFMQTAMCIYKYKQQISAEEITILAIKILLRYFKVYAFEPFNNESKCDYVWCIKKGEDINQILLEIFNCPCSIFNEYLCRITSDYEIEYIPAKGVSNPFESEDIKAMLNNGSSKEDIIIKLMDLLHCSRATAYRRLKKEGLTRNYIKKRLQE